jgi:hypothetical protein
MLGLPINLERLCMKNCFHGYEQTSSFFASLPFSLKVLSTDLRACFFEKLRVLPLEHLIVFTNSVVGRRFAVFLEEHAHEDNFGPAKITFTEISFSAEEKTNLSLARVVSSTKLFFPPYPLHLPL